MRKKFAGNGARSTEWSTIAIRHEALGLSAVVVERALGLVQSLDPTGIGARSVADCLALQAKEADRYDPCMARLIDNLDLVARGDVARLRRLCEVDEEDFAEMLAELRAYDPRPGLRFGGGGEAATMRERSRRLSDLGRR